MTSPIYAAQIGSGAVLSGTVASGQLGVNHFASGIIRAILVSGAVQSGHLGNASVNSGNVSSGSIGLVHLASGTIVPSSLTSGQVTSGFIGDNAVTSGNIASGQVGHFQLSDSSVLSGDVGSGQIASGHLASGLLLSIPANLSSGQVTSGFIGNSAVVSGSIASGQVASGHLASGTVLPNYITSGGVTSGMLGDSSVLSGSIGSGQIAHPMFGSGAILSGDIASGQIGTYHLASGTSVTQAEIVVDSSFVTAELISGGRAVGLTSSGTLQIAMAAVSGRMPAVGVLGENIASGQSATITQKGRSFSPNYNFSGFGGQLIFVGASGTLDGTTPGGPTFSGAIVQAVGVAANTASGQTNELFVDGPPNIFAATRVVDKSGVGATDKTIADAIAALPAAGGDIYVKGGTYPISASLDFTTKVVRLHGAGTSVNFTTGPTTLVPAAGISLFKNGGQGCSVEDIVAEGDNDTSQIFYEGSAEVRFTRVNVHDIGGIIKGTGEILFRDSFIGVPSGPGIPLADRYIWKGGGSGGTLTWDGVEVFVSGGGATLMSGATPTSSGPTWKVVNSYTGGGGGGGSTNFYYAAVIDWVGFDIDNAEVTVGASRNNVVNSNFLDFSMKFKAIWNFIANCNFSGGGTGGALFSSQLEFTGGFAGIPNESLVTNCNFYGGGSAITGITITNTYPVVITGCIFSSHTSRAIFFAGGTSPNVSKGSVTGCYFESESVPVVEGSTDVIARYESNQNFGGSTILGTKSIVNGENTQTVSATTTLDETYRTVRVDASGAARTINLPTAASARYRKYTVKKIESSVNVVTVDPSGAELIDGFSTISLTILNQSVTFVSNGTGWDIV